MQPDIEVLWISKFAYSEGYGIKPHTHNYYQIIYITSGEATFTVENDNFQVKKDYWMIIRPNQEHSMDKVKEGTVNTLDIKFVINDSEMASAMNKLENLLTSNDRYVPFLLEKIRNEGKQKNLFYNYLTSSYLTELLVSILREHLPNEETQSSPSEIKNINASPVTEMIIQYLREHYNTKIELNTLAGYAGYNKNYICMVFKKETGMTINNYIQSYRIYKAKELIVFSDYDLKQICEKVGFEDIHHFSRVFKKVEGVSPGFYRNKEKNEVGQYVTIKEDFINPDKVDKSDRNID
jgi:YesN/AraC family two-component response regulator